MSNTEGFIVTTPAEFDFFRYAQLKACLKMERAGLKIRGGALRPQLAKEFGLKARESHDAYIAKCVEMMNAAYEAKHGPQETPAYKV